MLARPDRLAALGGLLIGIVLGLALGLNNPFALHPTTKTVLRDIPPITRNSTEKQVLRHFHLGLYTRAGYANGEPAYEYVGRSWRVFFTFEQAGDAPPQGHPVQP